jgi:hypothetical protein
MTKLKAFWRMARYGVLGLAVAVVIGLAAQPAEARGHWHWNGVTYVWIETPYYAPYYGYGYYPQSYGYYPSYYYPPAYYYGPSIGFSIGIH